MRGRVEIVGRSWSSKREARDVARASGSPNVLSSKTVPRIPHGDYRVLVTAAAMRQAKLRGGSSVETRDHAAGKAAVDKMLVEKGLGVQIPCSTPGRVTR